MIGTKIIKNLKEWTPYRPTVFPASRMYRKMTEIG